MHGQSSIPDTRVAHMLIPRAFLGHTIPSSSHVASVVISLRVISSGMFLLSSS